MNDKSIKTKLIKLIDDGCAECSRLADSLTEAERQAQGRLDHWSARDLFFHLAFWIRTNANRLAARRLGEEPKVFNDDVLVLNDQVFLVNKERSFTEAFEEAIQAYRQMVSELGFLTDEDLNSPDPNPRAHVRPLYTAIFGDIYAHPITHLAQHQIERGRMDEARRLNERLAEATVALDDSPQSHGTALYNLACFHALCSEPARAVELLGQAFQLRPELVGWSKEDTDLVSLRDMPEFQALYA